MNEKTFKNPGIEWRGKPFWSWNGTLDKEECLRQIDVMKAMGMGGFFMHSRTGLKTEYLGEAWFDLINTCADYAESIGMEAWLYDEDRWPSGLAGGLVSQHPEFRQKAILLEIDPEGVGTNVVKEFLADIEGSRCTNLDSGEKKLRFSVVEQGKSGFYNGYTYIDTMNRKATEAFLECTHDKYAEKCGNRLGKSIKGIFTDEPHRGALLDGFSMYREDGAMTVPYTPNIFKEFERRFGYDLKPKLPELFFQIDGVRVSPVKWHYVELLQQLFIENFAIPCEEWCAANNLILTGHILHEDNLTAQTAMSGSVMRYYPYMTAPGVDVLGEENRNYWIVKQLSSVARQTGKKQLLSELYGCTGWQMPFAGHKAIGDWQALLGINLRCHHLSWYTMEGESKRDYPASILHQSAWHTEYSLIEDYFARFAYVMSQGKPVCDLLVINPIESVWAQVALGWSENLNLKDIKIKAIEAHYQNLFHWLMSAQVDFDYGDEALLADLGRVTDDTLKLGCAEYKTVLIAGMNTIRSSTLSLLDEFVSKGGRVIIAGDVPTHVDALPSVIQNNAYRQISFTKQEIKKALPSPRARVEASDIFVQLRTIKEGIVFAALNVDRDNRREKVTVQIQTDLPIVEWDCVSGERLGVVADLRDGWQVFETDFPAGGQKLWVASSKDSSCTARSLALNAQEDFYPLSEGPFIYHLTEPNICVLDFAEFKINDSKWHKEQEVLKIDQHLRDLHGLMRRGGQMIQPWCNTKDPEGKSCDLELRYTFEVTNLPEWVDLVFEAPEKFTVKLNGLVLDLSEDRRWIDIAFHRFRLPAKPLRHGKNEIVLKTRFNKESNIEAIYLLGDFGVRLDGICRHIESLKKTVEIGDLCHQGFPFYSGSIIYQIPLPKGQGLINLPKFGGACVKIEGQAFGWDPFEAQVSGEQTEVEVILTRRNTFGPLHDAVKERYWSHPMVWLTEGDSFNPSPVLLPSGLLQSPLYKVVGLEEN